MTDPFQHTDGGTGATKRRQCHRVRFFGEHLVVQRQGGSGFSLTHQNSSAPNPRIVRPPFGLPWGAYVSTVVFSCMSRVTYPCDDKVAVEIRRAGIMIMTVLVSAQVPHPLPP